MPQINSSELVNKLYKVVKDYTTTATNTTIVGLTAGIQQLTTLVVYRCPCINPIQLGNDCINATMTGTACTQLPNLWYGLSFLVGPAIALFVLGIASNPKLWKTITGHRKKTQKFKRECDDVCLILCRVFGQAIISPIAWTIVALLDGRFFACAATALPYDVGNSPSTYSPCEKVARLNPPSPSNTYNEKKSLSQVIAWILLSLFVILGILVYAWIQYSSPLTYYHAKYYKLYRESEEAEFESEMQKKAQIDANTNVLKFMEERRNKEQWDRIATVYEFHRDGKNLALYSYLHEWVLGEQQSDAIETHISNGTSVTFPLHNEDTVVNETIV